MSGKKLKDLTDSRPAEAYRKYKWAIEIVRWGSLKTWLIIFVILLVSYSIFLYEQDGMIREQFNLLFIGLIFSIWMVSHRIGYEDGFKDGYEFGHQDGAEGAVKELNNLNDEDIGMIEEMESMAEAERKIVK